MTLVQNPRRRPSLPPSGAIGALVNQRALTSGGRPAFIDVVAGSTVTWRDVALAARLLRDGCGGADAGLAGLAVASPTDFCLHFLAALAAGVPIATLDPRSSDAEQLWSIATLGVTLMMRDGGDLVEVRPARSGCAQLDPATHGRAAHPTAGTPARDGAAVVAVTRGSTGPAKLVPLTEGQLVLAAADTVRHLGLGPSDVGYCATPLHQIDTQVVGVLAALLSGGAVAVGDFDRRSTWATTDRCGATWMNLTPAMVAALAGVPAPDAAVKRRLRFARVSGAELPLGIHGRFWQATGVPLLESYSLAEAAGPVTSNPVDVAGRRAGSVGCPMGAEVRIVGENGKPAPAGQRGRVQLRGDRIMSHYLPYGSAARRRAPLRATDADGWLETGDVGHRTADGYLYLTGRLPTHAAAERAGQAGVAHSGGVAGASGAHSDLSTRRLQRQEDGAAERSSQVACGTPASPLRAAAFRP